MALLYLMDHVAAGMAGNYYVKMVFVIAQRILRVRKCITHV